MKMLPAVAVALLALSLLAPTVRAADDDASAAAAAAGNSPKRDLATLQGRWERKLADGDLITNAARAVKEIKGNQETVTYYKESGDEVVRVTTADFKLETSGRVRLYTYSNFQVTKGERGEKSPAPVSYIYQVQGDALYEAHGLLTDSPAGSKPTVVAWARVK